MKVFTVTTQHKEWSALTEECVSRLQRFAGVTAHIITAHDQHDSHIQKLLYPLSVHEPVWFFDSDWWMLKQVDLPPIPAGGIIATYCRTGHERYINSAADLKGVFGTTLFGADMSNDRVRAAFIKALHLQSEAYWNGKPKADESFLNIATQQLGLKVEFMGAPWNHCAAPDAEAIGLHAGGRWPKLEWLRSFTR